uniref:dolichol kinase n=1 Tax=Erythrolobus australicus TaxID=1077150 RepID=A0A7S1TMA0_9RHOD
MENGKELLPRIPPGEPPLRLALYYLAHFVWTTAVNQVVDELSKRKKLSGEFARKPMHIVSGIAPTVYILVLGLSRRFVILAQLMQVLIVTVLGTQSEAMTKRFSQGRTNDTLGMHAFGVTLLSAFLFVADDDPHSLNTAVALSATACLAIGDAAAALVGSSVGRTHFRSLWGSGKRSAEGSAAMFASSFLMIWLIFGACGIGIGLVHIARVAAVAALVEAHSPSSMDNVTIPWSVVTALLLTFS